MKKTIRLSESDLHRIVSRAVGRVLEARKPADRQVGRHCFKGVRYDGNGNPTYTCDTLSDDEKKAQGWKYSKKHGLHGQISDPTKLPESYFRESIENERDSHDRIWSLLEDAYNECLNISEGGDMYVKAFDETIFPLLRDIDSRLGWE